MSIKVSNRATKVIKLHKLRARGAWFLLARSFSNQFCHSVISKLQKRLNVIHRSDRIGPGKLINCPFREKRSSEFARSPAAGYRILHRDLQHDALEDREWSLQNQ